jgi:soluble lytic murein transglycosylase
MKRFGLVALLCTAGLLMPVSSPRAQQSLSTTSTTSTTSTAVEAAAALKPTNHPPLPADVSQLWMAPPRARAPRSAPLNDFATAVKLEVDGNFAKALPMLSDPAVQRGALGHYAEYYKGLAELRLARAADARATFQSLAAKQPVGYLVEATALGEAESDEALGDLSAALDVYERLSNTKTTAPDAVLMRMGKVAKALGHKDKATEAYSRVVYEFPFSDLAADASAELEALPVAPIVAGSTRYKLELGRAERLYGAKRYAPARTSFETLRAAAQGDDRELVNLRLAECDYFLKRPRNARDGVKPYLEKASRQGEALFFYAIAVRELGDHDEYMRVVRRLADDFADQSWSEEALNNLATHFIIQNDDEQADHIFREMYGKFPLGHYAERAAWKIGWWAYKNGNYTDTVRVFESAAANFPRSDYRPSWLYWSGRAHDRLKEPSAAEARYTLAATDYLNTYYGRMAAKHLTDRNVRLPQRRLIVDAVSAGTSTDGQRSAGAAGAAGADDQPQPLVQLPPNEQTVRALLALDLYDQAVDELRYAQKMWGDGSAIQATLAWIYNRRGDLRAGINAMKRAYPQFMAAGGEKLPTDVMRVLYPVNYWSLIRRYSNERQLDPYLIAALIAQESTFTADIRSAANAYGLMQLLPSTGRQYARSLNLARRFSLSMLTTAETNIKMGTAYFADLVRQFGGAHYALATYNAGPNRVARWISERPGVDRDEFIDDIPFPETQNYVKRILGTAEDYRRLYGSEQVASGDEDATPALSHQAKPAPAEKASAAKPPAKKKPAAKAPATKKKSSTRRTRKAA